MGAINSNWVITYFCIFTTSNLILLTNSQSYYYSNNFQQQPQQYDQRTVGSSLDLLNVNPEHEQYQQIYEEIKNDELLIDPIISEPGPIDSSSLQQMFLELHQSPANRRFDNNTRTYLDFCASQIQIPASDLQAMNTNQNQIFFGLNPSHIQAMHKVKQILMRTSSPVDTICMARALRDRPEINRHAWIRGLTSAVMSRPDMAGLASPPLYETMPSLMINNPAIQKARRQTRQNNTCTLVDGSIGQINGVENRLWYWREDIQLNTHHWYWHLSNPFSFDRLEVPSAARPDRRGELFYFFHQNALARYHAERLSNGLPPVVPLFINPRGVIPEPYYAYMTDANSARTWTDRPANTVFADLVSNRDFISHPSNISVTDRLDILRRIEDGIRSRALIDKNGRSVPLDSFTGIDLLGEVIEASIYSINPDYYDEFGIHNAGHFLIGLIADPDDTRNVPPGIMADGATAMRDPVFYTYHTPINSIFESLKKQLPPYQPHGGEFPLHWPAVQILNVQVFSTDGAVNFASPPNQLKTYWNNAKVDLVRGLDFNRSDSQGSVPVCVQHLDHEPFTYQISIIRQPNGPSTQKASIRIFMAPRFDGRGRRYSMIEQHKLFFTMDYFQVDLKPGQNLINRKSTESSLTVPWPQTLTELQRDSAARLTPYCGCGWPQHLLLPKGTQQGLAFDLFVMVTNGDEDMVRGRGKASSRSTTVQGCKPAPVYCGISGQLYPDSKPMGYPFDRLPYASGGGGNGGPHGGGFGFGFGGQNKRPVSNLEEYMFGISNMMSTQILIRHFDNGKPQSSFGNFGGRNVYGGYR